MHWTMGQWTLVAIRPFWSHIKLSEETIIRNLARSGCVPPLNDPCHISSLRRLPIYAYQCFPHLNVLELSANYSCGTDKSVVSTCVYDYRQAPAHGWAWGVLAINARHEQKSVLNSQHHYCNSVRTQPLYNFQDLAILCPWLNFGLPPRCPQVVWCLWGEIEPFSATLAQDGLADCDQSGTNPLKYSAMAGNWTRATGRTDSELSHWAIMTDSIILLTPK